MLLNEKIKECLKNVIDSSEVNDNFDIVKIVFYKSLDKKDKIVHTSQIEWIKDENDGEWTYYSELTDSNEIKHFK